MVHRLVKATPHKVWHLCDPKTFCKKINWAKDDSDRQDEPLHVFLPNSILEPRPQNKVPEQTEQTIEREKPKSKQPKLEQPEEPKQLEQENPKKQTRKREKEPIQIDLFSR